MILAGEPIQTWLPVSLCRIGDACQGRLFYLKEEGRPALTITTKLSDRGVLSMTGIPLARNLPLCRGALSLVNRGLGVFTDCAASDFGVENTCPPTAFG